MRLVVANRGEIAVRILRAARDCGLGTVALHPADAGDAPHVRIADEAAALPGEGPAAYLDRDAVVAAALRAGGPGALVHGGYGFLSEDADFAATCERSGLVFVGPSPQVLRVLGDKVAARRVAQDCRVPVLPATEAGVGADAVAAFFAEHARTGRGPGGIMIKAVAGGGGRGIREVHDADEVPGAYASCRAEARAGFGDDDLYAEALLAGARHVEVQIVGDGSGVVAVGDRDCSVQRRHQKLVEVAPAQGLDEQVRTAMQDAAVRIGRKVGYAGLGTVEFLLDGGEFVFLEVNPRIQVEHTVTEEVTGIDLVAAQLRVARGATLGDLGLDPGEAATKPRGIAVQARVNAERVDASGRVYASAGVLDEFAPPAGPGVRVDTAAHRGMRQDARYDPLLAKVVAHASGTDLAGVARKADRALSELAVAGVDTNVGLLRAVLADEEFRTGVVGTDWLGRRIADLTVRADAYPTAGPGAVRAPVPDVGAGDLVVRAPMAGTVVRTSRPEEPVPPGAPVAVVEAMKMEHPVAAPEALRVDRVLVRVGDTVDAGTPILTYLPDEHLGGEPEAAGIDLDHVRDDLAGVRERHRFGLDEARPAAVAKRHELGRRTARENIADLVDDGSLVEYGALAVAAQRRRRSEQDLIESTPADGLVCGVATVGAERFGAARARAVVLSYDYTVLAGTQGMRNHAKTDRMLELARDRRLPVVFFTEGGGGRPGDTDHAGVSGLDVMTFHTMGSLAGEVPLVGIASGRCFAGNAALLGICDVVIATPEANIAMGGPAMIEGGGLGVFAPEEIGPVELQRRNGVVHLVAADDADAVAKARQYLSYFQGDLEEWEPPDPRLARHVVPESRVRAYDVRAAVEAVADVGSVLELRRDHGVGVVTALVRVEGRPLGLIANDGHHLGGAIDAEAADKLAAFLQVCDAHGLPVISLCDTPGFMVGPDAERSATVTRFSRLFVVGARMRVPFGTIVLRKGYGLGAQAMAAGSFRAPRFVVAWPTGEIGGMGLEGAVRLGYRRELDAIGDPAERAARFDELVAAAYEDGKALTAASVLELDDVIDPADSRRWIRTLTDRP